MHAVYICSKHWLHSQGAVSMMLLGDTAGQGQLQLQYQHIHMSTAAATTNTCGVCLKVTTPIPCQLLLKASKEELSCEVLRPLALDCSRSSSSPLVHSVWLRDTRHNKD
ncbi:hypothetical protein ABBQ32_013695 [Trebouxia sp. C0010 RCD-2024]